MTGPTFLVSAPRHARRASLAASAAITTLAWCAAANALPIVGTAGGVVGGTATIGTVGSTETINQSTTRALIQWSSFNVGSTETVRFNQPSTSSITFNVIPVAFNNPADIEGTINANGGVWLYSPRGVIIGGGAHIDVGSLLITTGSTNYTLQEGSEEGIPMPPELANSDSIQIFGATAGINVKTGAQIDAINGFVVLHSEGITQDGSVTSNDGVGYVVGDAATVNFSETGGGLQLSGIDTSASLPGAPSLTHGGTTTGAWVGVYAPDNSFSSIINMSGTTEATGYAPSGAETTAVLLVGSYVGSQGFNNDVTDVNTTGGTITADIAGVSINSDTAELGDITANGGNITVETTDDLTVGANLEAVQGVYLASLSGTVTLNAGSLVQADSGGEGGNGVYIEAPTINSDPTSLVLAGSSVDDPSNDVTEYADGGNLQAGQIVGNYVYLEARAPGFTGLYGYPPEDEPQTGGNLTLAGNINGEFDVTGYSDYGNVTVNPGVTVTSGSGSIYLSASATVTVNGSLSASGSVTLTAGGDVDIGPSVLIQSDSFGESFEEEGSGSITVTAGGAVNADGTSELRAGVDAADPSSAVSVEADGGNLTIGAVEGTDVELTTANDLTINGPIYGSNSVTFDPANIYINANVTSGGTLDIDADEAVTVAPNVIVQSEGDLTIDANTIDADATSLLSAGSDPTDPTGRVSVTAEEGDLTVGQVSGTDVTLIDESEGSGNLTVLGAVLGTNIVQITNRSGNIDIEANVVSDGVVTMKASGDLDVGLTADNVLIQSDAGGEGGAGITLAAGGAYDAKGNSELRGGEDPANPTDPVTVTADGGDLTTGAIEGTDVTLTTDNDVFVNGAIYGSNSVNFDPANITLNANVTSGGALTIDATNTVTVSANVTVQSAGDLSIEADTINADATSLLVAGSDPSAPTADVSVTADSGDLTLGKVSGQNVTIVDGSPGSDDCDEDCGPAGGDVSLLGAILATNNASVTAYNGSIDVEANVISDGGVAMNAANDIDVGLSASGVLIQSDAGNEGGSDIDLTAGGAYDAAADSELRGGEDPANPIDPVTVVASGGDLTSGAIEATDVELTTDDDLTINGPVFGSNSVTFDPFNVFINADVTSGGTLDISADNDVTVAPDVTVMSAGDMTIEAVNSVTADATSLIVAGSDANTPTGDVAITADNSDLTVGQVTGNNVTLTSGIDPDSDAGGNVTVLGQVLGFDSVTVNAYIGTIDVEANVLSAGAVGMLAGVDIDVGTDKGAPAVLIQSDSLGNGSGTITLTAGRTYDAAGSSELRAGDKAADPTDAVTVTTGDGDLTSGAVEGTDVTLTTDNDLTINGPVYGSNSVTFDPANVFINANVTSGGLLNITATNTITVSANVVLRSDANGAGTGDMSLEADSISADPTSSLIAGPNGSSPPTANVTVISDEGALSVGAVTGKVVSLTSAGDLTVGGAVLGTTDVAMVSGGDTEIDGAVASNNFVTVQSAGDVSVSGGDSITAGSYIHIAADDGVSLGAGAVLRSNSKDANAASATADVSIDAGTDYNAAPTSLVVAGSNSAAPTNNVEIKAGDNESGSGGDLTAGQTSGVDVDLTALGATNEEGGNGNLTIGGAVFGSQGVFAYSNPGDDGSKPGGVTVSANVTSNGIIDIRSMGTGPVSLNTGEGDGPVMVSSSGGEIYILANDNDLSVGSNVQITGVSMDLVAYGALTVASTASLTTTGSTSAPTWPIVPQTVVAGSGEAAPAVTSLNLAAETISLSGAVTSGANDDIYIQAIGAPSLVTVGGSSGPAGFDLTASSFGELTGRNVVVMAGDGEEGAHNADLQLATLAIDPTKVSSLWLGTASGQTISVIGPVTGQGVNLDLGFAVDPTSTLGGYIPGEIDITGSLGAASAPLGSVNLIARNDIFMGTSGFITAAEGDPTFDAVTQSKNFTGLSQGYLFIAASSLELAAQGRIIQQNTSTLTGAGQDQFTGLAINAPTVQTPLIVAPSALNGQTIGTTEGWTANFGAGPTKIDVFGILQTSGDTFVSGVDAALLPNLLGSGIATSSAYRINSCIFGTNCSVAPPNPLEAVKNTLSFQPPLDPQGDYLVQTVTTFVSNIVVSDTDFDDPLKTGAPVTESGNGDLWNTPPPGVCQPTTDKNSCPPP